MIRIQSICLLWYSAHTQHQMGRHRRQQSTLHGSSHHSDILSWWQLNPITARAFNQLGTPAVPLIACCYAELAIFSTETATTITVLIAPTHRGMARLSWSKWMVALWDMKAGTQCPPLTRLKARQLCCSRLRHYHYTNTKLPTTHIHTQWQRQGDRQTDTKRGRQTEESEWVKK